MKFWPFKSSSTEVIFHKGCLPSNQNFENHLELHLSRTTNVTKQVWLIFSYFKLFRVGVPEAILEVTEAILDVPEAILDVPEAILCKTKIKLTQPSLVELGLGLSLAIKTSYRVKTWMCTIVERDHI
jgi:hypothetical protein